MYVVFDIQFHCYEFFEFIKDLPWIKNVHGLKYFLSVVAQLNIRNFEEINAFNLKYINDFIT